MERNFIDHAGVSTFGLLKIQSQVLVALMLRDIKTRFFGTSWGFLVSLAWPLAHILIVLGINIAAGRLPPYGDSSALWFATGIIPFMAFSYMSRFIMFGIIINRPLLVFPHVKIMDILIARAIIEILAAGTVILILCGIFTFYDIDFVPPRLVEAFLALGAAFLLGLGVGILNAIIAQAFPFWATAYSLSIIIFWITSGVFFVPDALPEQLRYPLTFSPITQIVTWFRSSYYDGYGQISLDKFFVVGFSLSCLCAGLVLERLARGRLLQG